MRIALPPKRSMNSRGGREFGDQVGEPDDGCARLYGVSDSYLTTGMSIAVPAPLATAVNAARMEIIQGTRDPEVFRRACMAPPGDLEVRGPLNDTSAAKPKVEREASPRVRKRRPAGIKVQVITIDRLEQRKEDRVLRFRQDSVERKAELALLDRLIELGPDRIVALKRTWRQDLAALRTAMPNFSNVVEHIEQACALGEFTGRPVHIPPLLLAGLPGVGKTRFAQRVAAVFGADSFVYALDSAETTSTLLGSDKHWANSEPGALFRLIMMSQVANPVVVLDELDKASQRSQYRPIAALHGVLEPTTSRSLRDKSVDLVFDASHVIYIATCNHLSGIEASVLARFDIHHVPAPDARAAVSIARSIACTMLNEMKLELRFNVPGSEIIQQLAMLRCPRTMHRTLRSAIGRAVAAGRRHVAIEDLSPASARPSEADTSAGAGRLRH